MLEIKNIITREALVLLALILAAIVSLIVFSKYPETPWLSAETFKYSLKAEEKKNFDKVEINQKPPLLVKLHSGGLFLPSEMEKYAKIRARLRSVSFWSLISVYLIYLVLFNAPIRPAKACKKA